MKPYDKALELINRFGKIQLGENEIGEPICFNDIDGERAHFKCAIISVEEILKSFDAIFDSRRHFRHELEIDAERYWLEVKKELENL